MQVVNKYTHTATSKDVYIGRGSVFGNKFTHIQHKPTKATIIVSSRQESIERFEQDLIQRIRNNDTVIIKALLDLPEDSNLVCFCKPQSCHGDVIVRISIQLKKGETI